jgi:XrtN system VIT domain protein
LLIHKKKFFIKNISNNEWQREEALYTLHLPNDAVVNSMSLWVNGVERKSRLTTKEKADSAYVQIVGVQNRDPALLHWQEGNRVNVTVFPCTVQEVRMLKVGYTTPLKATENELEYEDIYVEGPSFSQCRNDVQIAGHEMAKVKGNHIAFKKSGATLVSNFKNNKTWNISIPKVPLGSKCFAFNNKYFKVSEETEEKKQLAYDHIILDINANWTKSDYDKIIKNNKSKKIWYASDENTLSMVDDNAESVWDAMHEKNFQMIPFHKIDPAKSILITKPVPNAPSYTDLGSSAYARKLSQSVLKSTQPLTCLALHSGESDYLFATLHNMNYLNMHDVSIDQCLQILSTEALTERITDSRSVNIDEADINITMVDADSNTGAPDHLMRLYDYKRILQQSGKFFFDKSNSDSLKSSVDMANEVIYSDPGQQPDRTGNR